MSSSGLVGTIDVKYIGADSTRQRHHLRLSTISELLCSINERSLFLSLDPSDSNLQLFFLIGSKVA